MQKFIFAVLLLTISSFAMADDVPQTSSLLSPEMLKSYRGFSCVENRVCRKCTERRSDHVVTEVKKVGVAFNLTVTTNGVQQILLSGMDCNAVSVKDPRVAECVILTDGKWAGGVSTSTSKKSYLLGGASMVYMEEATKLNFDIDPSGAKNFSIELSNCKAN